jgi:hypothetical protein
MRSKWSKVYHRAECRDTLKIQWSRESFVGIEIKGRCLRIYADDTA